VLAHPSVTALNHLFTQNSWALQRLSRYAGKTARFEIAPFSLACTILEDGSVRTADDAAEADALCVIAPSLLPRLVLHDEKALAEIHSEGNAELLEEIFFLSRNMRWDAAEDLSGITGDVVAERLVQTVHSAQRHMRAAAENLSLAAAEYLTEESPLLAKPQHISAFMQQVDTLRDDVARLEQRIDRLLVAK
jgi:ubiquinone biosynthesis protein UbiJ